MCDFYRQIIAIDHLAVDYFFSEILLFALQGQVSVQAFSGNSLFSYFTAMFGSLLLIIFKIKLVFHTRTKFRSIGLCGSSNIIKILELFVF